MNTNTKLIFAIVAVLALSLWSYTWDPTAEAENVVSTQSTVAQVANSKTQRENRVNDFGENKPGIVIEVGTLASREAEAWIEAEIQTFMKAHPSINVASFAIRWPERYEVPMCKLPELAQNVIGIDSTEGYELAYLVSRDMIVPINEFLPDSDFDPDDIYENLWETITYDGKIWGVPYWCSTSVLLCDWPLFEEEGFTEPPKTWEQLLDYAKRLTKDTDGDGDIDQWGFRIAESNDNLPSEDRIREDVHLWLEWMTMVLQKGGHVAKDGRIDLSHPALREAYDFLHHLKDESGAAVVDNRKLKSVIRDDTIRYAMHMESFRRLKDTEGFENLRAFPWPTFGPQVAADEKQLFFAIRKSTPEKQAASWEFIKWMLRPDVSLNAQQKGPAALNHPCRRDLTARPDFKAKLAPFAQNCEVAFLTQSWVRDYRDKRITAPGVYSHLRWLVNEMFAGERSFEEIMAKAEKECNEMIRKYSTVGYEYALYR